MLIVCLTVQIHCATLLRIMYLFSVSDNSFEQHNSSYIHCMLISDIIDNYDCILKSISTIKSENIRFIMLKFHRVSLQYVINSLWIVHNWAYTRV